ncbi:MAG TPA: hypothetical protein VEK13_02130 [Thermoplasmata archaeon]|nr:hypothetical protein [Thermoplasmata archaeon]
MAGAGFPDETGGPIDSSSLEPSEVELARRRALEDPGASWKEWLYFTAFKWWMAIAFLIVDSWIVTIFLVARSWIPLAASTVAALYLEYLLYGYLWHRPDAMRPPAPRRFRWPPFEVGRWTPEGFRLRSGQGPLDERSPDPREFL